MQRYVYVYVYIYLPHVMQCNAIFNTLRFLFSQYSTYKNGLFYYQYKRADALCRHDTNRHRVEYAFFLWSSFGKFIFMFNRKKGSTIWIKTEE